MIKTVIRFRANAQKLERVSGETCFASGLVNHIEAAFSLEEGWTDFDNVRAVWSVNGKKNPTDLDASGACMVPAEVLSHKGTVMVNLVGSVLENGSLTSRLTSYPVMALEIDAEAKTEGKPSVPISVSEL